MPVALRLVPTASDWQRPRADAEKGSRGSGSRSAPHEASALRLHSVRVPAVGFGVSSCRVGDGGAKWDKCTTSGRGTQLAIKPRLSISVEPEVFELVHRLSDLGGGSVAAIIREILDTSRPVLEHLVKTAEAYIEADASKQADMLAALEASGARILPQVESLHQQTLDAFDSAAGS